MSRPNILFIVSDQERQRDWLPEGVNLPARQRLIDNGLEFTNHYTHTSPCSPARATLFTGQYLAEHGVSENSSFPTNTELSTDALTLGKLLREQGYTSAYKGKWHLEGRPDPDMEAYGFSDWEGNDQMFWGLAVSGTEYDEPIARSAADWIRSHGNDDDPWFLTVGLVNPHDIMATVGGTRQFNPSSLTVVSMFYWFNRGYRNHPMPNQIEAFKMAETTGIGNKGVWIAMLIAIVVGILTTFWANLDITFRNGAIASGGFKSWVGRESFNRLQRWLQDPTAPNLTKISFIGTGALLTCGMMFMRMRFLWGPFHPAGYALAISFAMEYFWFTFFLAGLFKLLIMKHGGLQVHRRLAPLFLGLILGDYVIGSIWAIIGPTLGIRTYKIFI